jgi:transposase-like protein
MPDNTHPKTLIEAVRHFADLDVCHNYMVDLKWPDGKIVCPACGSEKIGRIATRRMLRCNAAGCRKQFSSKVGTIFEDSPLGLDKWFVAVWCIANAKNGISSCELARAIGVTQRSAWFMLHRIRAAMRTGTFRKLSGKVESDETLARKLVQVPKRELAAQLKRERKSRAKKKRK